MTQMSPIVIAHHLIWTAYGCWLPNDPRGSMSHCIRNEIFADIAELHFGRKKVQPVRSELLKFFVDAETLLKYPRLELSGEEIRVIGGAIGDVIASEKYTCYALAIMPDHVHALIRKHKHLAEQMLANLQRESHLRLRAMGLRDMDHPIWGGRGWKVFLDHPDEVRRTIGYIENNPVKTRQPVQQYPFVKNYDGWPLHPGHSAKSPYVRALREAGRL